MTAVQMLWGPATYGVVGVVVTTLALDDSDDSVAAVFMVPKDGTIDRILISVGSITGNPPPYFVGLVTLDSSGNPTTSNYGGSATESYDFTANGLHTVTLATPATAAAGDRIAARIWPNTAPDGSNFASIFYRVAAIAPNFPYAPDFQTAWTRNRGSPMIGVRYSDDSAWIGPLVTNTLTLNLRDSVSPDEVGALLQLPMAASCFGARVWISRGAVGSTLTVTLYNAAGSTLATATIDTDDMITDNTGGWCDVYWDPVALAANADYRLSAFNSSTATAAALGMTPVLWDATCRNSWPEGSRWQMTQRNDAGAWTETDTRVPIMGLWLSDLTAAGGGAGIARLVGGGLVH